MLRGVPLQRDLIGSVDFAYGHSNESTSVKSKKAAECDKMCAYYLYRELMVLSSARNTS